MITYIFGSHQLSQLPRPVVPLLENLVDDIVLGDLNVGVDRLVQRVLQSRAGGVTIYYSGKRPLCNLAFSAHQVASGRAIGRDFFGQKEQEMIKLADQAICLWDNECGVSFKTLLHCMEKNVPVSIIPVPNTPSPIDSPYAAAFPTSVAERLLLSPNRMFREWFLQNKTNPVYIQQS